MKEIRNPLIGMFIVIMLSLSTIISAGDAFASPDQATNLGVMDARKARVVEYWTNERKTQAITRDLVIDPRGLGYLRKPNGSLEPYGHQVAAEAASQGVGTFAKPSGGGATGGDSTPPSIYNMNPGSGDEIGSSHTFSATITDQSGIKSVSFVIQYPGGNTQSFAANPVGSDTWTVGLQGFTDGNWGWRVEAKDRAGKGGNLAISETVPFAVNSGNGAGGTDSITNSQWTAGGAVQAAVGRIYFEMPANVNRKGPWTGYVCSGTVVVDDTAARSMIQTAAHCVYDDANKAFARNVLFIPDQAGTSGSGTDLNCGNDPMGCWVPDHGVVDVNWTSMTFPANIAWDYAYYVVSDTGAHSGLAVSSESLEDAAGGLTISFSMPAVDDGNLGRTSSDFTHALGYSYDFDPNLMYCTDDMTTQGNDNWWLMGCGLSGGSSGGPWVQPMDTTTGKGLLISVNSWGYTNSPGMAGPILFGTSAECIFDAAKLTAWTPLSTDDGDAGVVETCP